MKRATFKAGMAVLAATWPDRQETPALLEAYWMGLEDMEDGVFEQAVKACVRGCTFFPKPVEIRDRAERALTAAGVLPPLADAAWGRLMDLLRHWHPDNGWCAPARFEDGRIVWGQVGEPNGYCGAPSPLDELTEDAVRSLGGLAQVYNADSKQLGFLRRDFIEFYEHKRDMEVRYGSQRTALPEAKGLAQLREIGETREGVEAS